MNGLPITMTTEALQAIRERGDSQSDLARVKREAEQGIEPDTSCSTLLVSLESVMVHGSALCVGFEGP